MGLNPGGDPVKQRHEAISAHTDGVLHDKPDLRSEYSCESWLVRGRYCEPGEGGFQPSVVCLIEKLGQDPRDVPASNIVFVRTKNAKDLKDKDKLANDCWPLHRKVISQIQPILILSMGRAAQRILQEKTRSFEKSCSIRTGNGKNYLAEIFRNERGCLYASVVHSSRANKWTNANSDPSNVIGRVLEEAKVRWSSSELS